MNDSLMWAAHYRQRAAECIELADGSFDPGIEAHYRSLAGRYIKLAGAEEDFATGKEARTACLPDCIPPADGTRQFAAIDGAAVTVTRK
jgi:hypothetical protein